MRIGINATCLNERPSGAKQRFIGIYGSLFSLMQDTEFVIYQASDSKILEWFPFYQNISVVPTKIPSDGRIKKFTKGLNYWKSELNLQKFNIFESMHLPLIKSTSSVNLLTLHDIRDLNYTKNYIKKKLYSNLLGSALQQVEHVVTVSKAMRMEILNYYPKTSVSVIYNGIDIKSFGHVSLTLIEEFKVKYGLSSDFILAVGHLEKRKNYLKLVSAMCQLSRRGLDCPLLIIGNDSGVDKELKRQIKEIGLTNRIKILSGLTDIEVRCAYKMANLTVFPSLYEGFGIPILEAMASGCPIVLSDIPVFKEITEDRGIYFSPNCVDSMANAIEIGLTSTSTRNEITNYGKKRILDFSFDKLAYEMNEVYNYYK